MRPRTAAALALAAAALAAAPGARGDTLRMADGRDIVAVDIRDRDDGTVECLTLQGPRTFPKGEVRSRKPPAYRAAEFRSFLEAHRRRRDAGALVRVAAWCGASGMDAERREALRAAVAVDPEHAAAREALGQVKRDGRWVDPGDAGLAPDEARRRALAERYRSLLRAEGEVTLTAHFECVEILRAPGGATRAADLERAFAEGERVFGEPPWRDRCLVLALEGREGYEAWVDAEGKGLRGMSPAILPLVRAATGMKWHDPKVLARGNLPSTSSMHAANVHASGHLLANLWKRHERKAPFWIEEGFGGWIERRVLGSLSSYCYDLPVKGAYGDTAKDAKDWDADNPDFAALSRKAAADGTFLPLASLDALPRGRYTRREVGQSFTLVAWMIEAHGAAKFRDYFERVKSGTASPEAFRTVLGMGFETAEPSWKRWVATGW
jgi:hypothetical protein